MVSPTRNAHYARIGAEAERKGGPLSAILLSCRGTVTRTPDPLVPNQMRYQLRHTPITSHQTSWTSVACLERNAKVCLFSGYSNYFKEFGLSLSGRSSWNHCCAGAEPMSCKPSADAELLWSNAMPMQCSRGTAVEQHNADAVQSLLRSGTSAEPARCQRDIHEIPARN